MAYWLFLGNSPKTKWLQFQACKQAIHQNSFPFFPDWATISPGTNITVSHFYDKCINQPQLPHVKEKLIVGVAERHLHIHAWKEQNTTVLLKRHFSPLRRILSFIEKQIHTHRHKRLLVFACPTNLSPQVSSGPRGWKAEAAMTAGPTGFSTTSTATGRTDTHTDTHPHRRTEGKRQADKEWRRAVSLHTHAHTHTHSATRHFHYLAIRW